MTILQKYSGLILTNFSSAKYLVSSMPYLYKPFPTFLDELLQCEVRIDSFGIQYSELHLGSF